MVRPGDDGKRPRPGRSGQGTGRRHRKEGRPMTAQILGLGASAMDVVLNCEDLPREDGFAFIHEEKLTPGGSCANVLTAAAGFGNRTGLIAKMGDDEYGRVFVEDLGRWGRFQRPRAVQTRGRFAAHLHHRGQGRDQGHLRSSRGQPLGATARGRPRGLAGRRPGLLHGHAARNSGPQTRLGPPRSGT